MRIHALDVRAHGGLHVHDEALEVVELDAVRVDVEERDATEGAALDEGEGRPRTDPREPDETRPTREDNAGAIETRGARGGAPTRARGAERALGAARVSMASVGATRRAPGGVGGAGGDAATAASWQLGT